MSGQDQNSQVQSAAKAEATVAHTFAEFLESSPPDNAEVVTELVKYAGPYCSLCTPEIRLHCNNELCNGVRVFSCSQVPYLSTDFEYEFLTYTCRNCNKAKKTFALIVLKSTNKVQKLGELPPFGPPIPARVITLVGSDRELFLKGRRAELHGLGIGAFAYYRRVVEDKKGIIIEEIGKVAKRLGATPETLRLFAAAEAESQFSNAIELIKTAIPQGLLINGHNPLTLLHSALSKGIHGGTDDECLELATSIRLVLVELAERIAAALKDEAGLRDAVTRLLKK